MVDLLDIILFIHFLGVAGGVGVAIFMAVLGARASGLPPPQMGAVMSAAGGAAGIISGVSLVFLWGSGLAMVLMTEGMAAAGGHWFSAKIALAVGLTIVVGLIHRQNATMARGTDMAPEEREKVGRTLGMLSMCSLILSVTVVALAVMAFG